MNARLALLSASPRIPATSFFLEAGTFVLGRSSKCGFVVKDDTVSRRHAQIVVTPGAITVRDLGSRNGTFIDDRLVKTGTVREEEHVRFGQVLFVLTQADEDGDELDSDAETAMCSSAGFLPELDHADLSKAQCRVLDLLLQGLAEKQVAVRLRLSSATVHNHVQAIYRVFNVHSRSELLVLLLGKTSV